MQCTLILNTQPEWITIYSAAEHGDWACNCEISQDELNCASLVSCFIIRYWHIFLNSWWLVLVHMDSVELFVFEYQEIMLWCRFPYINLRHQIIYDFILVWKIKATFSWSFHSLYIDQNYFCENGRKIHILLCFYYLGDNSGGKTKICVTYILCRLKRI